MTGYDSKRRIALDRLDDDDIQVYAQPSRERPIEADYTSQVAYTRALELFCDTLAQPEQGSALRKQLAKARADCDKALADWVNARRWLECR